jgi:hypothetical protein
LNLIASHQFIISAVEEVGVGGHSMRCWVRLYMSFQLTGPASCEVQAIWNARMGCILADKCTCIWICSCRIGLASWVLVTVCLLLACVDSLFVVLWAMDRVACCWCACMCRGMCIACWGVLGMQPNCHTLQTL